MRDMNDMHDNPISALAREVVEAFAAAGFTIATAESCTGGLIAGMITDIPGSSAVFDRGYVTYSNDAKVEMLGLDEVLFETVGAVSEEVAEQMARNALQKSSTDIAISVTGIAGPGGGTEEKPVGLVWFGCACDWAPTFTISRYFDDNGRDAIRAETVMTALMILLETLREAPEKDNSEDLT
ncbi:MAG: CinA family protein [Ahrensia sp.]|nr:CinA family protein [Ahrensia sp.]